MTKKSLAITHPELAKQWHPTKNFPLTPLDITHGINKKVWWKCIDVGADDHEWQSTINNRSNGQRCPCCSGHKAVPSNCLLITHPELSKQWHPTKNLLMPLHVTYKYTKKIWWKCNASDDHEWITTVNSRAKNYAGCPYCAGQKVSLSNCLATTSPELAMQWHPTKNLPLTPFDATSGSTKRIWWKCNETNAEDHEWVAIIGSRKNGNGCPCCAGLKVVPSNCIAVTNTEIANQWHPTKNLLTPFDVVNKSNKRIWWQCSKGHEWDDSVCNRTSSNDKRNCPYCSNHRVDSSNCLANIYPEIAEEWHPIKNILTPFEVTSQSHKKVWWQCKKQNHEWEAIISNRTTSGTNCPFCNESHGEKEIKKSLDEMHIKYDIEKTFDGCKCKNKLPFDFYLPEYNALIEYDGIQHFEPIDFFGIKSFHATQKNDEIKNDFAAKNNIPLLRIPYTKFDSIENEIKSFISALKLG